jgi:Bifunctional DNA primase/polymerase, N-terminal
MTAAAIAHDVLRRGYKPVPVPIGKKSPVLTEWQKLDVTAATVPNYFDGGDKNVGAIMGQRSNGLADVDLDCREAVALASYFLPPTGSIYGRAGKRKSHYLYRCPDPPDKAVVKFLDETKGVIVELRVGGGGKGAQSIWPGSLHTSGERYEWDEDGEPVATPYETLRQAAVKMAVGTIIARHWPAHGRHDGALRVGGFLARAGWEPDAIGNFMTAVQEVAGVSDPTHVEAGRRAAVYAAEGHRDGAEGYGFPALAELLGEAAAKQIAKIVGYRGREAPEPTPSDARTVIKVTGGSLSANADDAERALIDAEIAFYERSNTLVRPIVKDVDGFHGTKTKTARLARVGPVYMRDVLGRIAHWYKFDLRRNQWVQIDPPNETAETVLARAGEWAFPTIAGIINTPTLRPDGTILDRPGFDARTRLLLIDPPAMAPIPDEPTEDDARKELEFFKALIRGFPFVGDVDRAVMLSALITPVARGGFIVVPMHTVDAPVAGAGKSYGLDLVSMIATGERMPVVAAGPDAEESEKRLGSALLAGQPLVCIDNISGVLSGDALCQYIERPRPQVRILGKSELITVETRGTSLFANGNNLVISGDLCRRVVCARLDPKMEDPELRVFKTDPLAMIAADRGTYIRAALLICRAYIAAGRPNPARRLASFEGWSDTVRSALIWLGEDDPVKSMSSAKAEDPERGSFRALLSAWADDFGTGEDNGKTLRDVVALAVATTVGGGGGYYYPTLARPNLNAALQAAVVGQSRRQLTASSLGYWLRARKDAIAGPYCFRNKYVSGEGLWWVEALTDEAKRTPRGQGAEAEPPRERALGADWTGPAFDEPPAGGRGT